MSSVKVTYFYATFFFFFFQKLFSSHTLRFHNALKVGGPAARAGMFSTPSVVIERGFPSGEAKVVFVFPRPYIFLGLGLGLSL